MLRKCNRTTQHKVSELRDVHTSDQGTTSQQQTEVLQELLSDKFGVAAARQLSLRLIAQFGNLHAAFTASAASLDRVTGHGRIIGGEFERLRRIYQALARSALQAQGRLDESDAVMEHCRMLLAGERVEALFGLYLDRDYHLLRCARLQTGTIDHVTVYPREVFAPALEAGATALILVHNHPAGNCTPSRADLVMTHRLGELGRGMGIKLADHIIVAGDGAYSFREHGDLTPFANGWEAFAGYPVGRKKQLAGA